MKSPCILNWLLLISTGTLNSIAWLIKHKLWSCTYLQFDFFLLDRQLNYWYADRIFSFLHIRINGLGYRAAETILERRVFQKKSAHQRCSWFAPESKKHRSNREGRKHSTQVYLKLIWGTSSYIKLRMEHDKIYVEANYCNSKAYMDHAITKQKTFVYFPCFEEQGCLCTRKPIFSSPKTYFLW